MPYVVFLPLDYPERADWPVLLFLHGAGERGDDGQRHTQVGLGPALAERPAAFPMIVVMPQCPHGELWAGTQAELALMALDEALREWGGDTNRCLLGGMSMGGFGTWYLALLGGERFAALLPLCGFTSTARLRALNPDVALLDTPLPGIAAPGQGYDAALAARIGQTPVWLFHGAQDALVPASESRHMAEALQAAGGEVRYTEYPDVGHEVWQRAFAEPALVPWLLGQRRP